MSKKRNFYGGGLYHIVNRGSKKELVFLADQDYSRFLNCLKKYCNDTGNLLIHYCLLPNHFHFLIRAHDEKSIPVLMQKLLTAHSKYICRKYNLVGSIFQDRYRGIHVMDTMQLRTVSRYIHRNPCEFYQDSLSVLSYPWSSFRAFHKAKPDDLISNDALNIIADIFPQKGEYSDFVLSDNFVFMHSMKQTAYHFE